MNTIIVPVDGASNIKLNVLDFDSLATIDSFASETPVADIGDLDYNCTEEEFSWFDAVIKELPQNVKDTCVIAPVARGASGGLIGPDNTLVEVPGRGVTLAYTQGYPERVEAAFRELAGDCRDFFAETGSIRDFPGSLTLIKRFLYEEMERPDVLERSELFGVYGGLMSGHFLGGDYLRAARIAGNEHSYWMCHTGARNIRKPAGTPGTLTGKILSFRRLVPGQPFLVYKPVGEMPEEQASSLGFQETPLVIPGGHDTCLSHIPIMSTYYQAFRDRAGTPVIHVEAGSWTLIAQIGGKVDIPPDACERDILVQGTVDGQPVVTARYGGGHDFKYVKELFAARGIRFGADCNESLLVEVLKDSDCFLLPNINSVNRLSGPYPHLSGKILNEDAFFGSTEKAFVVTNLTTAIVTSVQVDAIGKNGSIPLVLTAGGSRDPYFGRLLATVTGRDVYGMYDFEGNAVSETTSLGAAIAGKAACLKVHPYTVDVSGLGVSYRKLRPFGDDISRLLDGYRERLLAEIERAPA